MDESEIELLVLCINMGMEVTADEMEATWLNMSINRRLGILEELLPEVRGLETDKFNEYVRITRLLFEWVAAKAEGSETYETQCSDWLRFSPQPLCAGSSVTLRSPRRWLPGGRDGRDHHGVKQDCWWPHWKGCFNAGVTESADKSARRLQFLKSVMSSGRLSWSLVKIRV